MMQGLEVAKHNNLGGVAVRKSPTTEEERSVCRIKQTVRATYLQNNHDRESILSDETTAQAITTAGSSDTAEHYSEEGKSGKDPNVINL